MVTDERPDWIDHTLTREAAWEPPRHFSQRVVLAAVVTGSVPAERITPPDLSLTSRIRESLLGIAQSLLMRFENTVWVVRQYRELLWD